MKTQAKTLNEELLDSFNYSITFTPLDFEAELKRLENIEKWFSVVKKLNLVDLPIDPKKLTLGENSVYAPLLNALGDAYEAYQSERKGFPELGLPEVPKVSWLGMLHLFPFLCGKEPIFYVDADLSSAAVKFSIQSGQQVTVVTKTTKLIYLSKVGNTEKIRAPFILTSKLKIPTEQYLKQIELLITYL